MSRRWKGEVTLVANPRFVEGSPEHEKYKEKQKKYYRDTIDVQRERAKNRIALKRERNQQWMVNFLQGKSCSECGEDNPRVLAFDHLDKYNKYANVSDLVCGGAKLNKIVTEVMKCRILCHNCHMLNTFKQTRGTYHDKLSPCSEEEFNNKYINIL